jgi:tRNA1Val (adenine37-N6)-methyltransferase
LKCTILHGHTTGAFMSQNDKPFRFKQFEVHHSRSAMRVGTDAVLLASWVDVIGSRHILDVGTGTGVIALMCAQRAPDAMVEAIEIHEGSAEDAKLNFDISPWKSRLRLHVGDFLKIVSGEKFDRIISNPPYFSQSLRASDPDRSAARHDDYLPADAFLRQCKKLLNEDGTVSLILPSNQLERWMEEALKVGLRPQRICHVFTLAHKDSARVMIQFSFKATEEPEMESLLIQKSPGEFSEAYKNLTKEFYMKW